MQSFLEKCKRKFSAAVQAGENFLAPGPAKICRQVGSVCQGGKPFLVYFAFQGIRDLPQRPPAVHQVPDTVVEDICQGSQLFRISQLLQDNGYEEASKFLDCAYEL